MDFIGQLNNKFKFQNTVSSIKTKIRNPQIYISILLSSYCLGKSQNVMPTNIKIAQTKHLIITHNYH